MSADKLARRVAQFGDALKRLQEVMDMDVNAPLVLDAAMQRFEFTFELSWKALKAAAEVQGTVVVAPREAIKHAFAAGWIEDEALWLDLMKARNETSDTYNEAAARAVFQRVKQAMPALEGVHVALKELASP